MTEVYVKMLMRIADAEATASAHVLQAALHIVHVITPLYVLSLHMYYSIASLINHKQYAEHTLTSIL